MILFFCLYFVGVGLVFVIEILFSIIEDVVKYEVCVEMIWEDLD